MVLLALAPTSKSELCQCMQEPSAGNSRRMAVPLTWHSVKGALPTSTPGALSEMLVSCADVGPTCKGCRLRIPWPYLCCHFCGLGPVMHNERSCSLNQGRPVRDRVLVGPPCCTSPNFVAARSWKSHSAVVGTFSPQGSAFETVVASTCFACSAKPAPSDAAAQCAACLRLLPHPRGGGYTCSRCDAWTCGSMCAYMHQQVCHRFELRARPEGKQKSGRF